MKTDIENIRAENEARLKLATVAEIQTQFRKRWCPDDPYDRDQFDRDLNYLIHLIYQQAQAPLLRQMHEYALAIAPMSNHPPILSR